MHTAAPSDCGIAVWTSGGLGGSFSDQTNVTPFLWIGDQCLLWENPFKYVNPLKPSDRSSTYQNRKSFFVVSTNKGNSLYNVISYVYVGDQFLLVFKVSINP